jgi:uncharacterized protein (TIGR02246 family)
VPVGGGTMAAISSTSTLQAAMSVDNPRQMHPAWEKAFNGGDIDGLAALYEPEATLIPQPDSSPVTGQAAIREALGQLLGLKAQIQLRTAAVVESGDIALLYGEWSMTGGTGPDGNRVEMDARSTEIVRRQADGSWLYRLDDPFSRG